MDQLLFDSNPNPMLIYDWDTRRILRVNRAFAERYGYSAKEATELAIDQIRPEEDLPGFREALRKVDPQGINESGVHRHKASDGEVFYVKVTSQRYAYEGHDARLVSLVDVNESVEAERRARLAYEELSHHVRNSPLALVSLDREMKITEWSPQAEEISGLSRKEVLGRSPFELGLLPEEDEGKVRQTLRAMVSGHLDRHQQTLRLYHTGGAEIPIRLHTSALRDGEGGLVSVMSQIEDLSRQKHLEHRYQKLFRVG
ncbi:MAG: PAS domain S-box protein [Balneolaceae bacterium]|nr:PAS domain S-box protein [Balneolaceae bacterium]